MTLRRSYFAFTGCLSVNLVVGCSGREDSSVTSVSASTGGTSIQIGPTDSGGAPLAGTGGVGGNAVGGNSAAIGAQSATGGSLANAGARTSDSGGGALANGGTLAAGGVTGATGSSNIGGNGNTGGASCGPLKWSVIAGSPAGVKILGSGPNDLWIVSNNGVMRGDGNTWAPVTFDPPNYTLPPLYPNNQNVALWVSGANDVFVADFTHDVIHWNGMQWTYFDTGDNRMVNSLWGSAPDDVWGTMIISAGYTGYWDGTTWHHSLDGNVAGRIGGGARGDFWVVGSALVHHSPSGFDQTVGWSTLGIDGPACDLNDCPLAIWASATNDVWVAAGAGHLFHFDGANWAASATPTPTTIRGIWGSSRSDVWAVGVAGTALHFDGNSWQSVSIPTTNDLFSVWSSGPCDVWTIGDAVYHGSP